MMLQNPILPGMYPDPSICQVGERYYLVNSTFEYFPALPLFTSIDLLNWRQIGNCITRPSQLTLENTAPSDGIFAPTLRWHEGVFYVIVSCMYKTGVKNFILTATDPAGEWSDPLFIDFEGIDPSLFWENGRTYVQYAKRGEILQIEIDLQTGAVLKGPKLLTNGCGGRDVEGPHMWQREGYYYLLLAEGGTREGHYVTLMRGKNLWGPFEASPYNPVISNVDYGREPIQSVGHSDWVIGPDGKDYLVLLGTRPLRHKTMMGRETMLTPAYWTKDGWLRSEYGYLPLAWETNLGKQQPQLGFELSFYQERMPAEIISPRESYQEQYHFEKGRLYIEGNGSQVSDPHSAFWGVRQSELNFQLHCSLLGEVLQETDEIGIAVRASEDYQMDLCLTVREGQKVILLRKQLADVTQESYFVPNQWGAFQKLTILGEGSMYRFFYGTDEIGQTKQKHLSPECDESPNTGVLGGIYVAGGAKAEIRRFYYQPEKEGK